MTLAQVNLLNIGLMIGALVVAFVLPVELLLFSYAVLGPLHYLTEISWLHDRRYFVAHRREMALHLLLAVLVVLSVGVVPALHLKALHPYGPAMSFMAFGLALLLVVTRGWPGRLLGSLGLLALAAVLQPLASGRWYGVVFGLYLITIIHVFAFTGAFLLLGSLKSRSRSGYLSTLVFAGCAVLCFVLPAGWGAGPLERVPQAFATFLPLAEALRGHLGLGAQENSAVLLVRFLAYAYTYHYLNWFSKTSVIRWHVVPAWRFVAVLLIWSASVVLYYVDFGRGLQWLFFLSLLHVYLEFPLNHRSFAGIGQELRKRFPSAPGPTVSSAAETRA